MMLDLVLWSRPLLNVVLFLTTFLGTFPERLEVGWSEQMLTILKKEFDPQSSQNEPKWPPEPSRRPLKVALGHHRGHPGAQESSLTSFLNTLWSFWSQNSSKTRIAPKILRNCLEKGAKTPLKPSVYVFEHIRVLNA